MLRRRICAAALTAVLLLCAAPLSPAARAFSDTGGHWAQADIQKAQQYGLMEGYPDGSFGVDAEITRAEFVTILCRMFDWDMLSPDTPSYIDCGADAWYYSAVETARAHDVLDENGAFRPLDYISRGEMAVMLVRALGYDTLAQDLSGLSLPFDDVKEDTGYMAIAYDIGMIRGVAGPNGQLKFLPTHSATRAEAAAMLVRVYDRYHAGLDWLHGFYAFSSYAQINLTADMDAVSVGWAKLEYGENGPVLNSTSANGNDWIRPSDPTPATNYFDSHGVSYNLCVFGSAVDSVTLADGSTTSTVGATVNDPQARAQAISALVAAAGDYAGLTIDFEGLKGDDIKKNYVTFMRELRQELPDSKTLYVCVQPDTWYTGFDYRGLGEVCDKVILMAHDYQWTSVPQSYVGTGNTDSPVTPIAQVYEALHDITDPDTGVKDVSKVALAISFGTAGFHIDGDGRLLETTIYHPATDTLTARLNQPDTVVTYSEKYRNPSAVYTTEDGKLYRVWYEDAQSVTDKLQLAKLFGITGASLWRVGTIPAATGYDVWSAIRAAR